MENMEYINIVSRLHSLSVISSQSLFSMLAYINFNHRQGNYSFIKKLSFL